MFYDTLGNKAYLDVSGAVQQVLAGPFQRRTF